MEGEVTLRSTLIDCLQIKRQELAICSKHYNGLEPARGMEAAWDIHRREVNELEKAIKSLGCEKVRVAMADWQKDVEENGPTALDVEDLTGLDTDDLMINPINGPLGGRYEG